MLKAQTTVKQLDWIVGGTGTAAYANAFGLRFYSIRGTQGNWYLEYPKDGALFVHEGLETQIAARRAAQEHYEALVRFALVFQPFDDGGESAGFSIALEEDAFTLQPAFTVGEVTMKTVFEANNLLSLQDLQAVLDAVEAALTAPPAKHGDVEGEIASVVQSVNEWDDRTSPDDYPYHLLITSEELSDILRNFAATLTEATYRERLQAIIDWADLAMNNQEEFDSHSVRNLDGPVFDAAREALAGHPASQPTEAGR